MGRNINRSYALCHTPKTEKEVHGTIANSEEPSIIIPPKISFSERLEAQNKTQLPYILSIHSLLKTSIFAIFTMEATDEAPRRRGIERSSSTTSIPPQITSRRDSLFGNNGTDDDEDDYGYGQGDVMLSTANLYPSSTPRRRFYRRNGLCQFQMLQDAVHTAIDMNGLDLRRRDEERSRDDPDECEANDCHSTEFHTPSTPSFSSSISSSESLSFSARTRKVSLPMIHEAGTSTSTSDLNHYYYTGSGGGEESPSSSSRKLSRTCFRSNPSTGSIYTEESTL